MDLELAKIKAFYYAKVVELGGYEEASKLIQCKVGRGTWGNVIDLEPKWSATSYRIKPDTVIHPGGEMPKPLTVKEAENEKGIYAPILNSGNWCVEMHYFESEHNRIEISKLGLAFKTRKDAIAAGHVIFNLPKPENGLEAN